MMSSNTNLLMLSLSSKVYSNSTSKKKLKQAADARQLSDASKPRYSKASNTAHLRQKNVYICPTKPQAVPTMRMSLKEELLERPALILRSNLLRSFSRSGFWRTLHNFQSDTEPSVYAF